MTAANRYSPSWQRHFGVPDRQRTDAEVEFLRSVLPLPSFTRVLDVPCGHGRHRDALRGLGYDVLGVDVDPAVGPDLVADLRALDALPTEFDAAINMWASFGYFDDAENERVLGSLARRVRPGGRVVLDVYNRTFFEGRDDERELRPGITERSRLVGRRRLCEVRYDDGTVDLFDWQLYTSDELGELAARHELATVVVNASPDRPAMQLVFERC